MPAPLRIVPDEPRPELGPKQIAWLEEHMPAVADLRRITERCQAEREASREAIRERRS